jgi:hypothetical protein
MWRLCRRLGENDQMPHLHRQATEALATSDSLSMALRPGDQTRGWRRRWLEAQRELREILEPSRAATITEVVRLHGTYTPRADEVTLARIIRSREDVARQLAKPGIWLRCRQRWHGWTLRRLWLGGRSNDTT